MVIETVTTHLPLWLMIATPLTFVFGLVIWAGVSRKDWGGTLIVSSFLLCFWLLIGIFAGLEIRARNHAKNTPFKTEMVGVYDRTEYARYATIICLTNGRIYILEGRYNVPFKKGARIEILKNEGLIKIVEKK